MTGPFVRIRGTSRRRFLRLAGATCSLSACGWVFGASPPAPAGRNAAPSLARFARSASVFGHAVSLIVLHDDAGAATRALDATWEELRTLEELVSLYRPQSALCRLNRDGVLANPHPWLLELFSKARRLSEQTGGAFDVTVQPLWDLYAAAKTQGRLPDPAALEAARAKVDWRKLAIGPREIRLLAPGMAVTLNALAQGLAADRARATLRTHGIRHALVNTGEIGALGHREDAGPWKVGIQHPRQSNAYVALAALSDCCMATSGDYATRFSDDSVRHHIFNPATGDSPRELASATVVTAEGVDADGLATALLVLGPAAGLKLMGAYPGAEAFLVRKDGDTIITPNFPKT